VQASAAGQIGEVLRRSACRQVTVLVGKADYAVGVADVKPLGIGAGGIERYAEGLVQIGRKDRNLLGLAVRTGSAEDFDLAGFTLGQEEIAIGGCSNQAGIVQTRRCSDVEPAWGRCLRIRWELARAGRRR
jgi:hypothetical protein